MRNHTNVMSIAESKRLAELEKTIARGQKTFLEVGLALAEIRDLRLYKREYSSFQEYCREKWGWTASRARQLVASAQVAKSVTIVTLSNEAAARELGKVPAKQRAGVVEAIVAGGEAVTAAAIRRHIPPAPMQPSGAQGTASPTMPPPPPSQVLDGTGWPIPTQLIPLWHRADEVQEMLTTLSRVKGALRTAQENKDKLFAEVNYSSALSHLDQVWTDVQTAKPFAVCPTCQGQVPDKCTLCKGRGFISQHRWNTCVTREDKEFRFRAKQKAENKK